MKNTLLNILSIAARDLVEIFLYFYDKTTAIVLYLAGLGATIFLKYFFHDIRLLPWLVIVIGMDSWSGYRAAKARHKAAPEICPPVSGKVFREKLGGKFVAYFIALITLNAITEFEILGIKASDTLDQVDIFGFNFNFLKTIYYATVFGFMLHEARSVQKNLKVLGFDFLNFRTVARIDEFLGKDDDEATPSQPGIK